MSVHVEEDKSITLYISKLDGPKFSDKTLIPPSKLPMRFKNPLPEGINDSNRITPWRVESQGYKPFDWLNSARSSARVSDDKSETKKKECFERSEEMTTNKVNTSSEAVRRKSEGMLNLKSSTPLLHAPLFDELGKDAKVFDEYRSQRVCPNTQIENDWLRLREEKRAQINREYTEKLVRKSLQRAKTVSDANGKSKDTSSYSMTPTSKKSSTLSSTPQKATKLMASTIQRPTSSPAVQSAKKDLSDATVHDLAVQFMLSQFPSFRHHMDESDEAKISHSQATVHSSKAMSVATLRRPMSTLSCIQDEECRNIHQRFQLKNIPVSLDVLRKALVTPQDRSFEISLEYIQSKSSVERLMTNPLPKQLWHNSFSSKRNKIKIGKKKSKSGKLKAL